MNKKNLLGALLALVVLAGMTGCSKASDAISAVSTAVTAAGREYGQAYTGKMGETLTNAFFSYTVNSAKLVSEVGDYETDDPNNGFLVVNITVKNVFEDDESIPMANSDFTVSWGEGDENMTYAQEYFAEGQMADEFDLPKGESVTEDVVFIVPKDKEYTVEYLEYWDDDFEGNTYSVVLTVDDQTGAAA